jgi:hypothetical protein
MEELKPDTVRRVSVPSRRDLNAPLTQQNSPYDWRNMTSVARRSLAVMAMLAVPVAGVMIWALTRAH